MGKIHAQPYTLIMHRFSDFSSIHNNINVRECAKFLPKHEYLSFSKHN